MALATEVHDIAIGTVGLNLKIDPSMLPPGALCQADNVVYATDGVLRKRSGSVQVAAPLTLSTGIPTAMFVTPDGNPGYVSRFTAGRTFASTVGIPSAVATYARTLQIPLYKDPATGYLYAPQNLQSARNVIGDTQLVLAWDYDVDPTSTRKGVIYTAVWNITQARWDVIPQALTLPATAAFTAGTATIVGAAGPVLFTNNGTNITMLVSLQGTVAGSSYTQLATAGFTYNAGGGGVIGVVPSTQQGPATPYARPTVAPLPGPTSTGSPPLYGYAWASNNAAAAAARIGTIRTDTGAPQASAALTGAGTNGTPVNIAWVDSNNITAMTVDDNGRYELWNMTTLTQTATAVASGNTLVASATTSIATGVDGQNYWAVQAQTDGTYKWQTNSNNPPSFSVVSSGTVATLKGATQWRFASQVFFGPTINDTQTNPLVWVSYSGNVAGSGQKTFLLMALKTGQIIGRIAYLAANTTNISGTPSTPLIPQNVIGWTAGNAGTVGKAATFALLSSGAIMQDGQGNLISTPQVTVMQVDWGSTQAQEIPPLGTLTNGLSPAYITECDGYSLGFSYSPDTPITGYTQVNTGNVVGTVRYVPVYRYIDCYNNVHWSAPGLPFAVTISTGSLTAKVTLPAVPAPDHGDVVWFRTTNAGTIYYQAVTVGTGNVATDNVSDAQLTAANAFLYTTGGEVPNDPPPAATVIAVAGQRAYVVSAEQPWLLYYSKPFRQGHPVEFSASQVLPIAPQTGAITALGTLDDKLIIFKPNSMFLLSGDGPNVLGIGGFYGPSPLACLGGCTSPQSVVTTSDGLFYDSVQGITMLGRNLQEQYVGLPLDAAVGTIIGAVSTAQTSVVRFLDVTNSCVWLFDSIVNRWARHIYNYTFPLVAIAGNATGLWFYTKDAGLVTEQPSGYSDNGNVIQPQVQTGDIPIAGVRQGWGRLRRLALFGRARAPGSMTFVIQLAYDGTGTYTDTLTITQSPGAGAALQVRSRVPRQRMESVRILIQWPSDLADDLQISGVALEVAAKPGVYKLPAAQSY